MNRDRASTFSKAEKRIVTACDDLLKENLSWQEQDFAVSHRKRSGPCGGSKNMVEKTNSAPDDGKDARHAGRNYKTVSDLLHCCRLEAGPTSGNDRKTGRSSSPGWPSYVRRSFRPGTLLKVHGRPQHRQNVLPVQSQSSVIPTDHRFIRRRLVIDPHGRDHRNFRLHRRAGRPLVRTAV